MLYRKVNWHWSLLLSCLVLASNSNTFAAVLTVEPNKPYNQTFNITGREPGPYNIGVTVKSPLQQVIDQNNKKAFPDSPLQQIIDANNAAPQPKDPEPKEPVKPKEPNSILNNLFPNLFGDESHHHGSDGSDQPSTSSSTSGPGDYSTRTPSLFQPYLPSLPPRLDDDTYVCYNYVYEQLTGQPTTTMLNPEDIKNLLKAFTKQEYKSGTKLPDKFPPGTILFLAGHVGIVGQDGQTIFNYTKKSDENKLPATLHQTPSAQTLWQTRDPDQPKANQADYVPNDSIWDAFTPAVPAVEGRKPGKQPYVNSPVETYTPPTK